VCFEYTCACPLHESCSILFSLPHSYTIAPLSCFFLPSRCSLMLLCVLQPYPLCFSCQYIRRYCFVSWISPAFSTYLQAHPPFEYALFSFLRSALSSLGLVRLSCSALVGASVETLALTPGTNVALLSRSVFSTHHLSTSVGIVSALFFPFSHLLAAPLHTCVVIRSALGLSVLRHIIFSPLSSQRCCRASSPRLLATQPLEFSTGTSVGAPVKWRSALSG